MRSRLGGLGRRVRVALVGTLGGGVAVVLAASGCRGSGGSEGESGSSTRPAGGGSQASVSPSAPSPPQVRPKRVSVPSGISLPVQPGKGLGPVRFGATVRTIERLMGAPCDERRPLPSGAEHGALEVCRYLNRAVEFHVGAEGAVGMTAHHLERQPTPGSSRRYGAFNGRFVEGAALGMVPEAVRELLGPPLRVERLEEPQGAHRTAMVDHYPGLRLEYDRVSSGNLVLGGIVLHRAAIAAP